MKWTRTLASSCACGEHTCGVYFSCMTPRKRRWYLALAARRRDLSYPVLISGHCLEDKMIPLGIPPETVEACVRWGAIVPEKCEKPDKLVFRKFEKPPQTQPLVVVTRFRPTHIKVVTVYREE